MDLTNTLNGFIENLNEGLANNFSFSFRVSDTLELLEK